MGAPLVTKLSGRVGPSPGLSVALLVAVLAGCAHAPDPAPSSEPVRVATWNILLLNLDLEQVAADILASEAEVVMLQEVTPAAVELLDAELAEAFPFRRFDGELGLLSKRPVHWAVYAPPEHRRRGVQIAALDLGRTVLLANVHLEAQLLEDPSPAGIYRSLDRAEVTHLDELKMVLRRLDKEFPHIIAGDFNSLPLYDSRALLLERGYRDAADEAALWPDTTWADDAIFGVPFRLRIDYVFLRGGLKAVRTGVRPSEASDHHLLWVDLWVDLLPVREAAKG